MPTPRNVNPISDAATPPSPAEAKERAFERALREIEARLKLFASLPIDSLDRLATARRLAEIGAPAGTPCLAMRSRLTGW